MKTRRNISGLILSVFISALLLLFLMPSVLLRAEEESSGEKAEYWISDEADLFTADEEKALEAKLSEVIDKHPDVALAVMTAEDTGGKSVRGYGEDLFEAKDLGFGEDFNGLFILIVMEDRDFYIGTFGKAIKIFTDERLDTLVDIAVPDLTAGNYSAACLKCLDRIENYQTMGIPENQYEYKENVIFSPFRLIVSLLIFLGVGAVTAVVFRKNVIAKYDKYSAKPAYDSSALALQAMAVSTDALLNTYRSRHYQPVARTSSSSSSGRSTTHKTSSGRTSGGRGGKF